MYLERSVTLPKGQESFNLHVINSLFINSEATRKIYLKKLKQDVEHIKNDPNAKVILNGNLFYFDPYIFGFDNTRTMLETVKMDYLTRARVKDELRDINKSEDKGERIDLFGKLSPEAQIMYTKQLLKQSKAGDLHSLTPFTDTTMRVLQNEVFKPYIKEIAEVLEPIKDKIIAMNPGNEETKVDNFRQYDPMEQLAEEMGIHNLYTNERFTVLWVKFNNRLTDYKDQEISMLTTYGILNAKSHGAVETKMRTMYDNFLGFDFYVTSGYSKFGTFRENRFWRDKNNNFVLKPTYFVYYAGYDKVAEPNKVRMKSYTAENEVNNQCVDIAVCRNPVYINEKLVNAKGDAIEFDETKISNLIEVKFPKKYQKYIEEKVFNAPYKAYINVREYGVPTKIEEILSKIGKPSKIENLARVDLIEAKLSNAPHVLNVAIIKREIAKAAAKNAGKDYIENFAEAEQTPELEMTKK